MRLCHFRCARWRFSMSGRRMQVAVMGAKSRVCLQYTQNPDFKTDYRISPILAPSSLLAEFPPLLMTCGEKDPFVDDT
jgi:acetyl esterase/lipase